MKKKEEKKRGGLKSPPKKRARKTQHHRKTPLQRTKEVLEQMGYDVFKTEHWNPFVPRPGGMGIRQDLMGFCDLLAVGNAAIIAIQCGAMNGRNDHLKKIRENTHAYRWWKCGGRIQLWSWRKLKSGWKEEVDMINDRMDFCPF